MGEVQRAAVAGRSVRALATTRAAEGACGAAAFGMVGGEAGGQFHSNLLSGSESWNERGCPLGGNQGHQSST